MKILYTLIFALSFSNLYSQPNCEAFKYYYKDTLKYEACMKAEEVEGLYQFSKEYQEILDESIKIDSTYAYAYRRKSTAYLKSGDFITWKKLIDEAVKFNSQDNLVHRGYLRYLCFRDYEGAIKDLEELDSLSQLNIGYSLIGEDHVFIAKALCYKSIGEKEKAIQILETHLNNEDTFIGLYDYLHLGVIYLEQNHYEKALKTLLKQNGINEIAESQFYLALTYKALGMNTDYIAHLEKAKELYIAGNKLFQDYIDPIHKIYLEDIEDELKTAYHREDG